MRCFFIKDGRIAGAEYLDGAENEEAAIAESRSRFISKIRFGYDGFEVWNGGNRIYCYPDPCVSKIA